MAATIEFVTHPDTRVNGIQLALGASCRSPTLIYGAVIHTLHLTRRNNTSPLCTWTARGGIASHLVVKEVLVISRLVDAS